jgi:hypothetical protein
MKHGVCLPIGGACSDPWLAAAGTFALHDCRRARIGELLEVADLATTQQLAGHARPPDTAGYDRRPEATRRRAAAMLHVPCAASRRLSTRMHAPYRQAWDSNPVRSPTMTTSTAGATYKMRPLGPRYTYTPCIYDGRLRNASPLAHRARALTGLAGTRR